MKLLKLLITFISLLFPAVIFAATPAQELNTLLAGLHTMQADFTQQVVDNHGAIIQESQGSMALQRAGKFRWEVKKPTPQLIIANGKRMWIYDEDLEQVTIRTLSKAIGDMPALLLSQDNLKLEKDFAIKADDDKTDNLQWFILSPKGKDSMFASIKLGFAAQEIHEMLLKDHLEHQTIVKFQHVKTTVTLDPNLFQFTPPANVDVIDEAAGHAKRSH